MEQVLTDLYTSPTKASSYTSASRLYKAQKKAGHNYTVKQVDGWLAKQRVHQLYKRPPTRKKLSRVYANGVLDVVQIDLGDVPKLAKENQNVKYWLVARDVFSKMMWVRGLTRKSLDVVVHAMQSILAELDPKTINIISSDAGLFLQGFF